MRAVVTPKGLEFLLKLRLEQDTRSRHATSSPARPKSILKTAAAQTNERSREGRTHSVGFRALTPSKEARVRKRHSTLQAERERLMRRIQKKLEESREESQHCELSFLELDLHLPSPEKKRQVYLQNLREEQQRKYAKVWSWLDSKGFSCPKRSISRLS